MMRVRSWFYVCAFLTATFQLSAFASTVEVGTCSTSYPQYTTINGAISASPAGTTVLVCPGSYPEQVLINKKIILKGFSTLPSSTGATVTVPAGGLVANTTSLATGNPIAAQILVQGSTGVTISNLAVNGANNLLPDCSVDPIGIYFQNSSGTVTHAAVLNEVLGSGLEGCQAGLGIFIQSGNGGASVVNVNNSTVQNYQKNGITANEVGSNLTATSNTVVGEGPTTGAAENGIQLGFGAVGTLKTNSTTDDIWSPDNIGDPGDAAAGILIYASHGASITSNTVFSTQFGIAVVSDSNYGDADMATITSNKINATHIFDAIDACSNTNVITKNTINSADESGIHLDSTCGSTGNTNTVNSNTINASCSGILQGGGTNTIGTNTFYNVPTFVAGGDICTPPLDKVKHPKPHFRPARP
jgi:hypothetical protein